MLSKKTFVRQDANYAWVKQTKLFFLMEKGATMQLISYSKHTIFWFKTTLFFSVDKIQV
jgi:hypothetical protein